MNVTREDEFLPNLAHELRNHLAPISNALDVCNRIVERTGPLQELHQIMQRQVEQMSRLLEDVLDLSRIQRGKLELQREPVQLAAVVAAAVEAVQPLIESNRHQLIVNVPEQLSVAGDLSRLTKIFSHVLKNAAKFTPPNGRIEIEVRQKGNEALISIRDNGQGIPASLLTQIFEMDRPIDQTLERSHGGLGMGLTLVKRLVELHGGRVEARSAGVGRGSEFVVTLLLLTDASDQPDENRPDTGNSAGNDLPSLKILVVDDVRASGKTLALMLQAIGQHADVLYDGAAAVDWVIGNRPNVVFLDIGMPGMNGYDVAQEIRRHEGLRDVFLVALTGYGSEEDRRRALDAGFDDHLTKPTSVDALRKLLGTVHIHRRN